MRDLERCSQYRPQNWTILCRDVDDVLDHCLCTDSGLLTAIKLPSNCHQCTQKPPNLAQWRHKDSLHILLILLGVVGLRFVALCQVQITNRLLYH